MGDDQERPAQGAPGSAFLVAIAWIAVGIPMCWGVWMTLKKAALLFR